MHSPNYDIFQKPQGALSVWGKLFILTGGVLKPEKCFYCMIDDECQEDGTWIAQDGVQPLLEVLQKYGTTASIS
jgi:hypothetical protein